jgi:DNA-binding MarR family transcriptional regulator
VSGSKAVGFQSEQFLRLQMLRELDSAIDFARGFLQLRIVLALGSRGPMTARDISTSLGERYKAVLDAVRKLITKNLIAKEPDGGIDTYKLSDAGVEFYRKLVEILGVREHYRVPKEERRMLLSDVAMSITKYTHLADAILALGTSRSNALTLSDIADAMKLSPERAKTYIEMFSDRRSGVKLFKKVEKELKMLKLIAALLKPFGIKMRTAVEMYRLTEEGLTVFYKQPYYLKYKKSLAAKIVTKVFGAAHPRLVLKRMTLVTLIAALISSAIALITHNTAAVALTGSLSVASSLLYLGYKAI